MRTFSYFPCTMRCGGRKGFAGDGLCAAVGQQVAVRVGAEPEEAEGDMVSGTFFSRAWAWNLPLGRGFSAEMRRTAPLTVISYNYWTRRFTRRTRMCWARRLCERRAMTILGVAERGFEGVEQEGRRFLDSAAEPARDLICVGADPPQDANLLTIADPRGGACG